MSDDEVVEVGGVSVSITDLMIETSDRHYSCYYRKRQDSLLNQLCDLYGSDKGEIATSGHPYGWPSHSYADFLERTFGHCREHIRYVFECGLGTNNPDVPSNMTTTGRPGASLRVWRDYFPNAQIVGADVDREVLFQDDRIRTFHCDQTDPASIASMWAQVETDQFDLMIDDGLHSFRAGRTLLEHSFHKLRRGGIYIIEDVAPKSLARFQEHLAANGYDHDLVNLHRKGMSLNNNNLIVIRKS